MPLLAIQPGQEIEFGFLIRLVKEGLATQFHIKRIQICHNVMNRSNTLLLKQICNNLALLLRK